MAYSIAIRTLGAAGNKFRQELESIQSQTVLPEKVVVYIAEGYSRPSYTIGNEEYVPVKKGMMTQRALRYDEISTDCVLLLDDDVCLAPDSAERMIKALYELHLDCVGADVFKNHKMSFWMKMYTILTNLVFPHWSHKWAFKIHRNGSFSYNNSPSKSIYLSQSCGGPAMMWRKNSFINLHLEDELWLESLGFPYGEDALETYKLYRNGGRMGVLYDAGIQNLDAGTSSTAFRKSPERIYVRTKASFMIWWRSIYRNGKDTAWSRFLAAAAFGFKTIWLIPAMCVAGKIGSYFRGLREGWKAVHTAEFQALPPYIL